MKKSSGKSAERRPSKTGRPSSFKHEYIEQVERLCRMQRVIDTALAAEEEFNPVQVAARLLRVRAMSAFRADGGWAGEGDTVTETGTPQIGKLEIAAKKLYA